jgi:hypothetical protein
VNEREENARDKGCEKGFIRNLNHFVGHLEMDPKNSRFASLKWWEFDEFGPV